VQPAFPDDAALRDRLLSGDPGATERLVARHLDGLYEFVHYRLGSDRAQVEDVVQDTLLVALERVGTFDARSSLHAWLCGIARNRIRMLRRRRRAASIEDLLEDADPEIDLVLAAIEREPLPDGVLERRETQELVGATLSSLPPEYRTALLDKYVHSLPVREMADRAGKGDKAMESTLHRARLAFSRVFQLLARRRGGLDEAGEEAAT